MIGSDDAKVVPQISTWPISPEIRLAGRELGDTPIVALTDF